MLQNEKSDKDFALSSKIFQEPTDYSDNSF